ncbi:hypothetical protein C8J56DRAFT_1000652 [Mycena floridula]|nr:hypothetical protein C8J56DRAFT_1000652 [Mycena floridula]
MSSSSFASESVTLRQTARCPVICHLQAHPSFQWASVQNFSFAGATAEDDLDRQLGRFFVSFPQNKPESHPALDPATTCYILFLGINDCGRTEEDDLEEIVEKILDAAHQLYIRAGARNFIFIDVPPIDCSPAGTPLYTMKDRVETWNVQLNARVSEFAQETPKASVLRFSAHATFMDILDDPETYGFEEDDKTTSDRTIWSDDLHATSAVHEILAERLSTF